MTDQEANVYTVCIRLCIYRQWRNLILIWLCGRFRFLQLEQQLEVARQERLEAERRSHELLCKEQERSEQLELERAQLAKRAAQEISIVSRLWALHDITCCSNGIAFCVRASRTSRDARVKYATPLIR